MNYSRSVWQDGRSTLYGRGVGRVFVDRLDEDGVKLGTAQEGLADWLAGFVVDLWFVFQNEVVLNLPAGLRLE